MIDVGAIQTRSEIMQVQDFLNIEAASKKVKAMTENQHTLSLLTALTGTGKTTVAAQYLIQNCHDEKARVTFFVTDQKKNFPTEPLKKEIARQLNVPITSEKVEREFYRRVGVLYSLADEAKNLLDPLNRIPDYFRRQENFEVTFNKVKRRYKNFCTEPDNDEFRRELRNELRNWRLFIRDKLVLKLTKRIKTKEVSSEDNIQKIQHFLRQDHKSAQNQKLCDWVNRYYPLADEEQRKIFLLTTNKFITSYTPFYGHRGIPFITSHLLNDALVILDEIDATKVKLLDYEIANTINDKENILALFAAIEAGLARLQREVPKPLSLALKSPKTKRKLQALVDEANELSLTYRLYFPHKSSLQTFENNFIFHFPYIRMASSGLEWWTQLEEPLATVKFINNKKAYNPDKDLHFYQMLARVSMFIDDFVAFIRRCAHRFADLENADRNLLAPKLSLDNAAYSIYSLLGFNHEQQKMLVETRSKWLGVSLPKLSVSATESYRQLQRSGLSFYQFKDAERHAMQTEISASKFRNTPERFLLGVLSKADVLGMSATAEIPTVLDNYYLTYLHERLGNRFISANTYLTEETKQSFKLDERYKECGVQILVSLAKCKNVDARLEDLILNQMAVTGQQRQLDAVQMAIVEKKYRKLLRWTMDDVGNDYKAQRYAQLIGSFITFLLDTEMIVFLGLQSLLPKRDYPDMDLDRLLEIFNGLATLLCAKSAPVLKIITPENQGSMEEQCATALQIPKKQGKRVYLLSAYQSLGVGVNLQHPIGALDEGQLIDISGLVASDDDGRFSATDINGIYLGDVTHIFSSIQDFSTLTPEAIKLAVQHEYLLDNSEINQKQYHNYWKGLSHVHRPAGTDRPATSYVKQLKDMLSYRMSYTKVIIQALGRMTRTHNRRKQIRIIATEDVFDNFDLTSLNTDAISPEAKALAAKSPSSGSTSRQDSMKNNLYQNRTYLSYVDFKRAKGRLQLDVAMANAYQNVREWYLQHPTASEAELAAMHHSETMFMQYLPSARTEYGVCRMWEEIEKDGKKLDIETGVFEFGDDNKDNMIVSAERAGLPTILKYPGMAAYFDKHQYATTWQKQDYILNPVQFINGYLGILGEVAATFILDDALGINLSQITAVDKNELFDFIIDDQVLVDIKNWHYTHTATAFDDEKWVMHKLNQFCKDTGKDNMRVMVINVIDRTPEVKDKVTLINNNRILEVSALIDDQGALVLSPTDKQQIGEFLID